MLRSVQVRLEGCLQQLVEADLIRRVQRMLGQPAGSVLRPHRMANPDSPLRGTVLCPRCGRPLTAAWSRGHGGKYGYYRCIRCSCVAFRKEAVEPAFATCLNGLSLRPLAVSLADKNIDTNLDKRGRFSEQARRQLETKLAEERSRKRQIVEKSLNNTLPDDVVRSLLQEVDRDIEEIEAGIQRYTHGQHTDLDKVKAGLALLEQLGTLWQRTDVAVQKRLQRFVFPNGVVFDGSEFGTRPLPSCLQLRDGVISRKGRLVRPTGLEPVIYGSGGHRLIQLGHGRARRQV